MHNIRNGIYPPKKTGPVESESDYLPYSLTACISIPAPIADFTHEGPAYYRGAYFVSGTAFSQSSSRGRYFGPRCIIARAEHVLDRALLVATSLHKYPTKYTTLYLMTSQPVFCEILREKLIKRSGLSERLRGFGAIVATTIDDFDIAELIACEYHPRDCVNLLRSERYAAPS